MPELPPDELTPAEVEALIGLARGETIRQSAKRLRPRTENSVRCSRQRAARKLGAANGPHAVALALTGHHITAKDITPGGTP